MQQDQNKMGKSLIIATFVVLIIYNIFYTCGKLMGENAPSVFQNTYSAIRSSWGLFTFLEFLGVASLFVDIIIKFDKFPKRERNMRLGITVMVFIGFAMHFIIGLGEKYIAGEVQ